MDTTGSTRGSTRTRHRRSVAVLVAGVVALAAACLPSGAVDATFGGPTGAGLPCGSYGSVMATSATGATVVACSYEVPEAIPQAYGTRLVSRTAAGVPDDSFGSDGVVEVPLGGPNVSLFGVTRASDGGVLVAGLSPNYDYRLYRYTSDGSLDTGFGPNGNGYVLLGSNLRSGVMSQTNGLTFLITQETATCVGCGSAEGLKVRLFDASGQLGATITVPLNAFLDPVPDEATEARVVLDPQVAGFDPSYGYLIGGNLTTRYTLDGGTRLTDYDVAVVRLVSPGVLDPAYGTAGLARIDAGYDGSGQPTVGDGLSGVALALALQGSRVAFALAPDPGGNAAVGRVGADGLLDGSFGGDGLVAVPTSGNFITGLSGDLAGRTVLTTRDASARPVVRRLTSDGSPDATFGTAGALTLPAPSRASTTKVSTPLAASFVLVEGTTSFVADVRLFKVT